MKILLISLLSLVCSLSASAQQLEARSSTINLGQVAFRQPAYAEYEIVNKSNHSTKIWKVYTSCGCATADYPKENIQAGATFTVRVTYDANTMGHFEKEIGVYTNNGLQPLMLKLKGIVVEEVVDYIGDFPYQLGELKTDQNAIEFDDVNRGDRPMAKIHIMNSTDKTVEPVIMHLPDYIEAEVSPSKIAPGRTGVAIFTLNSHDIRNYGLTQTSVYLGRQPGDRVAPQKEIAISAVLLPSFSNLTEQQLTSAPKIKLSTTTLNLGPFNGKKKLKGEIDIQNIGHSTLDISQLQMYTTGLEVMLNKQKIEPGEYAKLRITAHAKNFKLVRNPRVLMITNDPDQPKVIISVKSE